MKSDDKLPHCTLLWNKKEILDSLMHKYATGIVRWQLYDAVDRKKPNHAFIWNIKLGLLSLNTVIHANKLSALNYNK